MGDPIKLDLEALGRLRPQIESLVDRIKSETPTASSSAGADPALAALQDLTGRTLPNVQKIVTGFMGNFAEVEEAGRRGFIATEEHGAALFRAMPDLHRQA
ncbi:hypothetical protein [Mycobacteroides abscessus]|uniref:hypothetical protein n=1 Tax=Mycobacteroides abscessus TaxID=36809 RepID=UPI0019D08382|nr:hypothetical protein [Mycobacteroides abscessus]MBN7310358.1 hypothetical protein [Mycobacteroides abscessus subsp. abscessus]